MSLFKLVSHGDPGWGCHSHGEGEKPANNAGTQILQQAHRHLQLNTYLINAHISKLKFQSKVKVEILSHSIHQA